MATVFLDLYGVLADADVMNREYNRRMAAILQRRFGGEFEAWRRAQVESFEWYQAQVLELDRRPGAVRDGDRWVRSVWDLNANQLRYVLERMEVAIPANLWRLSEAFEEETVRGIDATFPDVKPALQRLRSDGHRLFLSTNANRSNAESALVGAGIRDAFEGLLMLETAKAKKDRALYWRTAFALAGVRAAEAVVVDDVAPYLRSAADEGARGIQLCRGDRPENDARFLVIRTLEALPALLG